MTPQAALDLARRVRALRAVEITKKEQGHRSKPSRYSHVADEDFLDRRNWKYPVHDKAHTRNALARLGDDRNREAGGYTEAEWAAMKRKANRRAREQGIETEESKGGLALVRITKGAKMGYRLTCSKCGEVDERGFGDRGPASDEVEDLSCNPATPVVGTNSDEVQNLAIGTKTTDCQVVTSDEHTSLVAANQKHELGMESPTWSHGYQAVLRTR